MSDIIFLPIVVNRLVLKRCWVLSNFSLSLVLFYNISTLNPCRPNTASHPSSFKSKSVPSTSVVADHIFVPFSFFKLYTDRDGSVFRDMKGLGCSRIATLLGATHVARQARGSSRRVGARSFSGAQALTLRSHTTRAAR